MKKNLFFSSFTIVSRVVNRFLIFLFLSRIFDLSNFGIFTYAFTLAGIGLSLFEYGHGVSLLYKIPQDLDSISQRISDALPIKFILFLPFILVINLDFFLTFLNINTLEQEVVNILIISSLCVSVTNLLIYPFKATNRFHIETIVMGADGLFLLSGILIIYFFHVNNVILVSRVYLIVKLMTIVLAGIFYFREYYIKINLINSFRELKNNFEYAIFFLIGGLLLKIDVLILKQFVTNEEIAIYQSGLKIIIGSSIFIMLLNSVLIPHLSYLKKQINIFSKRVRLINSLTIISTIALCFFIYMIKENFVQIIWGDKFTKLNELMNFIIVVIGLRYLEAIYGILLTLAEMQKKRSFTVIITLVIIILGDYILIPLYEIKGAMIVMLIAYLFSLITNIYFVKKTYKTTFIYY